MKNQHLCTGYDSPIGIDRRNFLQKFGGGLGGLALADMLHAESGNVLHHPAKAKRVIYLFSLAVPLKLIFLITNQD